jgi:transglutaminase-like putative cysteine protease
MNRRKSDTSSAELYQAFALLCIAVIPIAAFSPGWAVTLVAILLGWRLLIERSQKTVPPQWLRVVIGLICFALVYVNYRTLNGLEAATPLLLMMMGLKIVETETKRDLMVLMLLSLFGLATALLHNQGIFISVYMVIVAPLLLAQLVTLSHPSKRLGMRPALSISLKLLVHSIPFALALFFLFPRLDGPLWGAGQQGKATTGMPQQLSMGDITELTQSPNVAFRVQFNGLSPKPQELYWRVAVMTEFDGKTWSQGQIPELANTGFEVGEKSLSYTLTLEPQHNKYVPVLERFLPSQTLSIGGARAELNGNWQITAKNNISERQRYSASASPEAKIQPQLGRLERRRGLIYSRSENLKAIEWGRQLAVQYPLAERRAAAILQHFSEQQYYYSLRPPPLGDSPVDEFLFETKKGFCEHYASSFVLLMRASGVPSRVVIGYQGGEYNADGDYWIVRQLDAHAWTEIWVEGEGWIRIDPTFAVAPERVELGIAASVLEADLLPAVARRGSSLFRSLRLKWDSAENRWNQLVLGYGEQQQREFLQKILPALGNAENMVLLLTIIISTGTLILVFWLAWKNRPLPVSATEKSYCRYLAWLSKQGVQLSISDGPTTVAEKVARRWPARAKLAHNISTAYIAVRYQQTECDSARKINQQFKAMQQLKSVA